MKQAEDQRRDLGVRLEAEPALVGAHVVERLVDDRQADDGVDDVAVDADIEIDAGQHRRRMSDGEQADIGGDVLRPVEEEDHAEQEQDVVVARDHVLGPEIDEGDEANPGDLLNVALVALGDGVRKGRAGEHHLSEQDGEHDEGDPPTRMAWRTLVGRSLHGNSNRRRWFGRLRGPRSGDDDRSGRAFEPIARAKMRRLGWHRKPCAKQRRNSGSNARRRGRRFV